MDSFPKWLALGISALIFSVYHGTYTGFFSLANTLVIGLLLGLNYIYTQNLWFCICFHIAWMFMAGPVLGYSGNDSFQTLLQTELIGDENITGGAIGPEGSAILMAVSLLSGLVLYLFLQKNSIHDLNQFQVKYKVLACQWMICIKDDHFIGNTCYDNRNCCPSALFILSCMPISGCRSSGSLSAGNSMIMDGSSGP